MNIDPSIEEQIQRQLELIEQRHHVTIILAIESGSRAWGFRSPDSDYDVRFIYRHHADWYIQLNQERDLIEVPINDELDISGWDIRKAFQLANNGNTVIQEWIGSPIIYRQSSQHERASSLIRHAFRNGPTFHHYYAMAKKLLAEVENSHQKQLKRFCYFARATLSAWWIVEHNTMPSIEFQQLLNGLPLSNEGKSAFEALVLEKRQQPECSEILVSPKLIQATRQYFETLPAKLSDYSNSHTVIHNADLRSFLQIEQ